MHACTLDRHFRFDIRAGAVVEERWIMSIHYQDRGAPKLMNGLPVVYSIASFLLPVFISMYRGVEVTWPGILWLLRCTSRVEVSVDLIGSCVEENFSLSFFSGRSGLVKGFPWQGRTL